MPSAPIAPPNSACRRQHVRQVAGVVGDRVDVEEHRAGHVRGEELGLRVALQRRQMPRAVDHRDPLAAEPRGEPVGRD
jgi:hypothetical protein